MASRSRTQTSSRQSCGKRTAALEGNLRDLDPQVLELLGFVWDQDDTEAVPLANRELPPELTSQ